MRRVGPFACLLAISLAACGDPAARQVDAYRQSRLAGELSDYEAAHLQGRLLDACTRAGQIAAAYREADSPDFLAWDAKRKEDCKAALDKIMPPADDSPSPAPGRRPSPPLSRGPAQG